MPEFRDGKFSKCAGCNRPRDNWKTHPSLCPVCLVNQAVQPVAVCDRFVGKREWGIGPTEPWRRCVSCDMPKAQHELPACKGVLNIAGVSYGCQLNEPHDGWGHSNKEAQAIWV